MGPRCSEVEIKLAYKSAQVCMEQSTCQSLINFFLYSGLYSSIEGKAARKTAKTIFDNQRKGEQAIHTVLPRMGELEGNPELIIQTKLLLTFNKQFKF